MLVSWSATKQRNRRKILHISPIIMYLDFRVNYIVCPSFLVKCFIILCIPLFFTIFLCISLLSPAFSYMTAPVFSLGSTLSPPQRPEVSFVFPIGWREIHVKRAGAGKKRNESAREASSTARPRFFNFPVFSLFSVFSPFLH